MRRGIVAMPDEGGRIINVGGNFKVDLNLRRQKRESARAVVELYCLLENFYYREEEQREKDDIACEGREKIRKEKEIEKKFESKRFVEVSKILEKAKIEKRESLKVVLCFSFPSEIKIQYGLKDVYHVELSMGKPTSSFIKDLQPHLKNGGCKKIVSRLDEAEKVQVLRFVRYAARKRLLSKVRRISFTKYEGIYISKIILDSGGSSKITCDHLEQLLIRVSKDLS